MGDDEVRCLADDLLREASDSTEFPEYVRVHEGADTLTLSLSLGSADITYKPQADAERIIRRCETALSSSLDNLPPGMGPWLLRARAGLAVKQLLINLHHEFRDLLSDLPAVSESQAALLTGIAGSPSVDESKEFERRFNRRRLAGQQLRNREQRLREAVEERRELVEPPLLMISFQYKWLHRVWKEVKKRYKRYRVSEKWREHLMFDFAEYDLPSDLLDRLDVPNRGNYEAQPSALALEHCARLCGATKNLGIRRLRDLLKESENWEAACTPEEFNSQFTKLLLVENLRRATLEADEENTA